MLVLSHDLFAVLARKARKRERRFPLLLVSWFLRSCIFITAGLSVWVGRYKSRSVFSLCNVGGSSGRCAAGAKTHILYPRSPAKQLHTSIRENPQLCTLLEQVRELMVTSDDCHIATGWPLAPGTCSVYNWSSSWNKWSSLIQNIQVQRSNHRYPSFALTDALR